MHYFLFDSQHPELSKFALFGPPCTQRVVWALERLNPIPTTRLIRGNVMPEHGCYRLARFKVGGSVSLQSSSQSDEYHYEPDHDLFKTVVCDLAETLSSPPSTVPEKQLLLRLARGSVWAVGASATTDMQALQVDGELREFGPYLGMAKLDLGTQYTKKSWWRFCSTKT